jgi:hypothetical protein
MNTQDKCIKFTEWCRDNFIPHNNKWVSKKEVLEHTDEVKNPVRFEQRLENSTHSTTQKLFKVWGTL